MDGPSNDPNDTHSAVRPGWVEQWTLYALILTLLVAALGVFEADRLARDTETALVDARDAARAAHDDNVRAENETADEIGRSELAAIVAHADNLSALQVAANANANADRSARQQQGLTRDSNDISRQAFTSTQRAFMNALGVDLEPLAIRGQKGAYWLTYVNWSNSGNTPTSDLIIRTDCYVSSDPVADPYHIPASDKLAKYADVMHMRQRFVFGPHQTNHAGFCEANWLDAMFSKLGFNVNVYVAGEAEYRDVLLPKSIHVTEFCFQLNNFTLSGDKTNPSLTPMTSLCGSHNCADDECSQRDRDAAAQDLNALKPTMAIAPQ